MTTEKYKCIESNPYYGISSGEIYNIDFKDKEWPSFVNYRGNEASISLSNFNRCFQKVEPTTTQTMKYKVTITSADHTGHEDTKTLENQTESDVCHLIEEMRGSTFHIEPMPEKKKVTVHFYVVMSEVKEMYSVSHLDKVQLEKYRDAEIKSGRNVSEIKSMEVEI